LAKIAFENAEKALNLVTKETVELAKKSAQESEAAAKIARLKIEESVNKATLKTKEVTQKVAKSAVNLQKQQKWPHIRLV
jgi:hypothetical protein